MKLKKLLEELRYLSKDTKLYIHEVDDNGNIYLKPLKGIALQITDKKLSFGAVNFDERIFEKIKKKGCFTDKHKKEIKK